MKAIYLETRHAEIVENTVTALVSGVLAVAIIGLATAGIVSLYNLF